MSHGDRFNASSIPDEVAGLREGVEAPDLSASILREVERRRGWLSRRQRLLVGVARWCSAAAVLALVGGVLLVQRATPVDEVVSPEARPLADLMRSVRDETSVAVRAVSTRVREFPEAIASRSREMVTARVNLDGNRRVIDLAGPVSVVDEVSFVPVMLAPDAPAVEGVAPEGVESGAVRIQWGPGGYRTGMDLRWAPGMAVPGEGETPLFEASGLDRRAR